MSAVPAVTAPPAHLLDALDRLTATPESAVRLDARHGALQLTTQDPSTGIWETLLVPLSDDGGGEAQPTWSATVRHGDLRRAAAFAPSQGLTQVELRRSGGRVTVDGDPVPETEPIGSLPESHETVPVELDLPEGGPAVALAGDTGRLRLSDGVVSRLRARPMCVVRAFERDGRWYLSVRTGDGDVWRDPVVVAEVADAPVGTE